MYHMILDTTISSYNVINTHIYSAFVGFMTNPPMHILMILSYYYPLFHHSNITRIHTPYLVWYRHWIQIWYFLKMVFGKQSKFSTADSPIHTWFLLQMGIVTEQDYTTKISMRGKYDFLKTLLLFWIKIIITSLV